jgi:hypothetical protein
MKLSFGEWQFLEWKSPLLVMGTFCPSPMLTFYILNALNVLQHGGM